MVVLVHRTPAAGQQKRNLFLLSSRQHKHGLPPYVSSSDGRASLRKRYLVRNTRLHPTHDRARVCTSMNAIERKRQHAWPIDTSPGKLRRSPSVNSLIACVVSRLHCNATDPSTKELKKSQWRVDRQTHPPHHASAPAPPFGAMFRSLLTFALAGGPSTLEHPMLIILWVYSAVLDLCGHSGHPLQGGTAKCLSDLQAQSKREVHASLGSLPSKQGGCFLRYSEAVPCYETVQHIHDPNFCLCACLHNCTSWVLSL